MLSLLISVAGGAPEPDTFLASKTVHVDGLGSFYPGWAFRAHSAGGLGYPPIPLDGYPTYSMQRSTAAYFLGNDTGLNSAAEYAAEAKFGIVGIGWQIGMRSLGWQHLEAAEVETARALKALNPEIKVLVSRNTEVATVVWDAVRPLLVPPGPSQHPEMWVHGKPGGGGCAVGAVCNSTWDCPNCGKPPKPSAVPFGKLYFNWTSSLLVDWWLGTHIGAAIAEEAVDGVYFDCSCGPPAGINRDGQAAFMAASQAAFDRHLPLLASKKKMTIAWNGERISQGRCAQDMTRLLSVYANATNETFQLIYDNNPANLLPTLAAFLLIRGPHGLFQYTVIGPYECASAPCGRPDSPASGFGPYHWSPLLELDYGTPVRPAVQGRDGVWRRQWTKADVSLNCSEWVGRVELHN